MKTIRKLHFWMGTLFAPTIVFFALSGAFQVLGLHEGSSGAIAKLAQIHKDQSITEIPPRKPRPAPAAQPRPTESAPIEARVTPHRSMPLVIWFLVMAVGLMFSTGLGIYMAFAYKRDRVVIISLLVAGTAIPLVSLLL